jgi:threonine aldolase
MTASNQVVDLRSDTITRPTPAMRRAMAEAEVGDDVFGEDSTTNALQQRVADLLGKEAAIFVPSGSMANQTSIRAHTSPGDEIICDVSSHAYLYEGGAPAAISGCSYAFVQGERGVFTVEQVKASIKPAGNHHFANTRLVLVENTHNRGGGSIWPVEAMAEVYQFARQAGLAVHLDGARLMNACVATGKPPTDYTRHVDSCSICFSKGLGAPVGSAVAGTRTFIDRVHRFRKMFGGGMRQTGILAAAALYALDHHVERLADDHAHAKRLATAIADVAGIRLNPDHVQTNIVIFDLDDRLAPAEHFVEKLGAAGVRMLAIGPARVRAVANLEVDQAGIDRAINVIRKVAT